LKDEIIQLGTRYGIVTPYTSFLVTEDMKDIGRRTLPMEERRALDSMMQRAPSGGPGSGGGLGSGRGGRAETVTVTGESAVVYSKAENKMKGSDKIETLESYLTTVRTVGDKTFQMNGDEWVDTEVKDSSALPKVQVQFGSEEFFNLIAMEPKLAEFFSLGKKVTVVFKGKIYRVTG
jgi:Ca-activated chloride channel family protein